MDVAHDHPCRGFCTLVLFIIFQCRMGCENSAIDNRREEGLETTSLRVLCVLHLSVIFSVYCTIR